VNETGVGFRYFFGGEGRRRLLRWSQITSSVNARV